MDHVDGVDYCQSCNYFVGACRCEKALPTKTSLLPCPFCGNRDLCWGNEGEHIQEGYEVRCCCTAEIWGATREEAEARWNRRTEGVTQ